MTNYTKSTNFASKDSLASGNPAKIVKGTEIDTEFNNIVAAVATKADALSPTFTGVPLAPTAAAGANSTQLATTAYADAASAAANYLDTTRIDVASANTINLTTSAPTTRHINITGTTQINGFTVVAGKTYFVRFNGSLTLNNSATLVTQVGRDIVTASGDTCIIRSTAANTVEILDYSSVVPDKQIQSMTASVAANALTITLNATRLDFRAPTVSSGTVSTRYVKTTASLVVPSGATLGTTDGVASKLVVLALDNAGSVELAVANTSVFLDESLLISTALLDSSSDAVDVVYSTTVRTNVAFRIVGYITSTQTTAGTWASAPSIITGGSPTTILAEFASKKISSGTTVATTSGTFIDFTGIPSWAKRITVLFNGVSTTGVSTVQMQIGSGSVTTTGYESTVSWATNATNSTTGLIIGGASSGDTRSGSATLITLGSNIWVYSGTVKVSAASTVMSSAGNITLSGPLDRVRITTITGTDTFDAGSINILYE